ncbi:uncharacterized protein LOC131674316 [Phymastichus coffea]|uniref:uncharacterized protein LOC131674316 n=1 Tax=Phymastichus coffea TaxID=108790 RepID=UPI00273A7879|nr:uncharacterized protein LOC131674316 [Phymastichus coffea]
MPTAVIKVRNQRGKFVQARTLLDSCSTVNLISENFANSLNLPKLSCYVKIGAVDKLSTVSKYHVKITFQSVYNNSQFQLNCLIVPNIAGVVPNDTFLRNQFNIPGNIHLADPQFHLPKPVDLLLASSTTFSVLNVGQIKLHHHDSTIGLQKTLLGWVVVGGTNNLVTSTSSVCNVVKLDKLLERFWIIEDFDHEPVKSRDEVACEEHYSKHTSRDPISGRYVVRLPFRDNKFDLGGSKLQALTRFHALERKFECKPSFKEEYSKVMEEYISLGHMVLCNEISLDGEYYLPHHAVNKESSETTKLRVVFDASAKTSTDISLNDVLMVGPTIQNTIFEQILRFRIHPYVITGDIEKMYRQILVHPDDRRFQKVLWYHQGKIQSFKLNTVTFGMASAPFLAIRTIQQLARDEAHQFPRASKLLLRDFHVDDFISGADTLEEIVAIRDEMVTLLQRGGFIIRKWASNHPDALDPIEQKIFDLDSAVKERTVQKTLGIVWNSQEDLFQYSLTPVDPQTSSTKRKLLSEISKIFDPLGLLGPISLYAKVLIQDCWKAKQPIKIELHGFCDASLHGYGACLFVKSTDSRENTLVRLIASKSRVAPLSGVTIPRLELYATSILKRLYVEVKKQLDFLINRSILWSDSTIVLCWLKKAPHLLRTFESNRVADLQSLNNQVEWRHVQSKDNPADALSRGQLPSDFAENTLWVSGPSWLASAESKWPFQNPPSSQNLSGLQEESCLTIAPSSSSSTGDDILSRFSSYERLVRVVALISRWRQPSRDVEKSTPSRSDFKNPSDRTRKEVECVRPLLTSEIISSENKILSLVQKQGFPTEYRHLSELINGVRKGTPFDKLCPFIGTDKLIRVGGRLNKSQLPYDQKHPILLPSNHHVTQLIIR